MGMSFDPIILKKNSLCLRKTTKSSESLNGHNADVNDYDGKFIKIYFFVVLGSTLPK